MLHQCVLIKIKRLHKSKTVPAKIKIIVLKKPTTKMVSTHEFSGVTVWYKNAFVHISLPFKTKLWTHELQQCVQFPWGPSEMNYMSPNFRF